MKVWTVQITDQNVLSVQSDLDLHCPQKLLLSSSVRKEISNKQNLAVNKALRQTIGHWVRYQLWASNKVVNILEHERRAL